MSWCAPHGVIDWGCFCEHNCFNHQCHLDLSEVTFLERVPLSIMRSQLFMGIIVTGSNENQPQDLMEGAGGVIKLGLRTWTVWHSLRICCVLG
jgi:hypothetical protein